MSYNSPDERLRDLKKRFGEEILTMGERSTPNSPALSTRPRIQPIHLVDVPPRPSENDIKFREVNKKSGQLKISGVEYKSKISDLHQIGELGSGTCGHVVKMLHKPSEAIIAVKQMRRSGNSEETKRILMDLEIVRSHCCPYIVRCLGFFVTDADVWICMELMDSCFDKLLKRFGKPIPERILGKVTVSTVKALSYLKDNLRVMHRDVKPSNILVDEQGNIKLCDFGISGKLIDSRAKTRTAGCAAYMAPERIEPPNPYNPDYDIRADVWSLGISLVELATGMYPYKNCDSDFALLTKVLKEDPPRLPDTTDFSPEFKSFVEQCLTKDYIRRPKYVELLEHPFIVRWMHTNVDVASWYSSIRMQERSCNVTPSPPRLNESPPKMADPSPLSMRRMSTDTDSGMPASPPTPIFKPRLGAPVSDWRAPPRLTSISQPPSLEAARECYSPYLMRRSIEKSVSPPPISCTPEAKRRPSLAMSGNTSPIVMQRYVHQNRQRTSRADMASNPSRFRSLSNDTAGRSPEPPPRRYAALNVNAVQERLHSPIPQRFMGDRSNSLTRAAELVNGWTPYGDPLPPALQQRLSRENLLHDKLMRDNLATRDHAHFSPNKVYTNGYRDPISHDRKQPESAIQVRDALLQERLHRDSMPQDKFPQPQRSNGQKHQGDPGVPSPPPPPPHSSPRATIAAAPAPADMLAAASPPTRWGGESWSVPASPRPPRAPRPTPDKS